MVGVGVGVESASMVRSSRRGRCDVGRLSAWLACWRRCAFVVVGVEVVGVGAEVGVESEWRRVVVVVGTARRRALASDAGVDDGRVVTGRRARPLTWLAAGNEGGGGGQGSTRRP